MKSSNSLFTLSVLVAFIAMFSPVARGTTVESHVSSIRLKGINYTIEQMNVRLESRLVRSAIYVHPSKQNARYSLDFDVRREVCTFSDLTAGAELSIAERGLYYADINCGIRLIDQEMTAPSIDGVMKGELDVVVKTKLAIFLGLSKD
jgi:hypothetical protein